MLVTFNAAEWERFVRAWQESNSIGEVCRRVQLDYGTAANRARTLRLLGVPLKPHKPKLRGRNRILTPAVVERLSRIARGEKPDAA